MSAPITALIFDMDGLLVDSEPLAAEAMDRFLAEFGLVRDPVVQRRVLGRRLPEAVAIVKEGYALSQPVEALTARYSELRIVALRGHVQAMPGAHALIAFARRAGLAVALATSGMRTHADVSLGETGLAGAFDAEVTGDEVERGKPAPDLFLLAAERIAHQPAGCVVFEDSPSGIAAAVAAGMRPVAVPNAISSALTFSVAPEIVLASLNDAIPWLMEQGVVPLG